MFHIGVIRNRPIKGLWNFLTKYHILFYMIFLIFLSSYSIIASYACSWICISIKLSNGWILNLIFENGFNYKRIWRDKNIPSAGGYLILDEFLILFFLFLLTRSNIILSFRFYPWEKLYLEADGVRKYFLIKYNLKRNIVLNLLIDDIHVCTQI